jgi:hypothetical protein
MAHSKTEQEFAQRVLDNPKFKGNPIFEKSISNLVLLYWKFQRNDVRGICVQTGTLTATARRWVNTSPISPNIGHYQYGTRLDCVKAMLAHIKKNNRD